MVGGEQVRTSFLRDGWLVEMELDGWPFTSGARAALEVCNIAWKDSKQLRLGCSLAIVEQAL